MARRLRAEAMGLTELLGCYEQFLVPEFQRVYGWGEFEIERLLGDLDRAMATPGQRFFLGTLYLAQGPETPQLALIADGQQRLLTATIVCAVARDLTEDRAQAERLHAIVASQTGFRLVPRDLDAEFFRTWVQQRGATLKSFGQTAEAADGSADQTAIEDPEAGLSESQRNIIVSRDAIAANLRDRGQAGMRRLLDFLERDTDIAVVTAPTIEEARNAYASTQNRGLRQAETDKLKAELIADCPIGQRVRLAGQWEECEAILGKENLADLFQYMLIIRNERRPQHAIEVDLFKAFGLPAAVEEFINAELVPGARAYAKLGESGFIGGRAARRAGTHIVALTRMTHSLWKAPALLGVRTFEHDPAALEAFLAGLERLAASLMIRGIDPYLMLDRYVSVIRAMKANPRDALAALELSEAERAEARRGLLDTRFAIRDRYRMPVLLKINDLVAGSVQAIDPKKVSCEHVLPRNVPAASPWRAAFRTRDGRRYEGGRYVHMLGNLTVLTHAENRLADTRPYPEKRRILKRSALAISKEAAKSRAWTPEVVLARSERLAQLVASHWRF